MLVSGVALHARRAASPGGSRDRLNHPWLRVWAQIAALVDSRLLQRFGLSLELGVLGRLRAVAALKEEKGWPEQDHAYAHLPSIGVGFLLW